ncbi:unnamed protein product [Protopolystoma xenopodis]|uniref:Uncharacterized protein n=1 Tax=Protopolystoma xenopodis TaxID=117903 RepID=A0A3S5CD72_9PLAT|nr:unnamed protein product [Protopolystoma xenopodis]
MSDTLKTRKHAKQTNHTFSLVLSPIQRCQGIPVRLCRVCKSRHFDTFSSLNRGVATWQPVLCGRAGDKAFCMHIFSETGSKTDEPKEVEKVKRLNYVPRMRLHSSSKAISRAKQQKAR